MQTPSLNEILGRAQRPKFIHGLRIEEISGVDHPAHEVEGWAVMKSRDRAKKMGSIGSWHGLVGNYAVIAKSVNKERRYTLGLLYAASNPGDAVADAHGDSISESELYTASLNYVKGGDRSIHFQHGTSDLELIKFGEWIHLMQWPNEVTEEFTLPGNKMVTKVTIPANSVWVGIEWNELGWGHVKSGQIRGLSLGGFRRRQKAAEETGMAKQEKPIQDPLEGYIYKRFQKALPDGTRSRTNTGDADQPLTVPSAPVRPGSTFGPITPRSPMDNVTVTDHKPRLDRRFREFLAGLEDGLDPDRYRAMLEAIAAFNDRFLSITSQDEHIGSLKLLASDLRKIMASENDVVKILRMGRFVAAEELEDLNTWQSPEERIRGGAGIIPGIGKALMRNLRRGQNQNALSSFDPHWEDDPIGMKAAEKRKHGKHTKNELRERRGY